MTANQTKTGNKEKILCPHCGKELDQLKIRKSAASILGKAKSEKKTASCRENAKKPRPRKKLKPDT